uniref:nuclear transport factor 2 family protein n=1 Tax=Sphingomonas populi TaxID=2484750 RepID=UPI001E64AD0A|nr:nuclear transport factor 2 family protein [Sphingomonas populi]
MTNSIADPDLKPRRIAAVRRHMALEIAHEWDEVLATFEHPRYELRGPGTVFDGVEAVRRYLTLSRILFPDQGNEVIAIVADDADTVFVEFGLTGTNSARSRSASRYFLPPASHSACVWPPASNLSRVATRFPANGHITTATLCSEPWD